jgi:hypothetical protein
MVKQWSVRTRQSHGAGDWPVAWRLVAIRAAGTGRLWDTITEGAARFAMRPRRSACGRDAPAPCFVTPALARNPMGDGRFRKLYALWSPHNPSRDQQRDQVPIDVGGKLTETDVVVPVVGVVGGQGGSERTEAVHGAIFCRIPFLSARW